MKKRFLFLLILFTFSCVKTEISDIPYARVHFKVNLQFQDSDLIGETNYKIFTKPRLSGEYTGFSGILTVCGFDGNYYAYDLCCPHEARQDTKIEPTNEGTAKCPKCGTVYDTGFGIGRPLEGVSRFQLRRLNISYINSEEFVIHF